MVEIRLDDKGRYIIETSLKNHRRLREHEDTLYLFEWTEYLIVAKDVDGNVEVHIGDEKLKLEDVYRTDRDIIIPFEIKNYIGKTKLRILKNGKEVPLRFKNFEVLSEKIPKIYPERICKEYRKSLDSLDINEIVKLHNEFYESIVDEIYRKCVSLPFSIRSPTDFEFVETEEPINELFAYHFLRSNKERIISADP